MLQLEGILNYPSIGITTELVGFCELCCLKYTHLLMHTGIYSKTKSHFNYNFRLNAPTGQSKGIAKPSETGITNASLMTELSCMYVCMYRMYVCLSKFMY